MTKKNSHRNAQEEQLIQRLRQHPELRERFESILEISAHTEGPIKSADEVDARLIEELRRLGNTTMRDWAAGAEQRLGDQLRRKDPSAGVRKKTLKWWCVFGQVVINERIWRTETRKYVRLLPEGIGVKPWGRSLRLQRVLTDFGCEHSFGHAAARVFEHYGFEISASAVRETTLAHVQRAAQQLEEEYREPFRVLPAAGAGHVIVEADGTMICTVAPGKRQGKKQPTAFRSCVACPGLGFRGRVCPARVM